MTSDDHDHDHAHHWPDAPIKRWVAPITRFMHIESSSGILLLGCTLVALVLTNSQLAEWFLGIWKLPVEISIGSFVVEEHGHHFTLGALINDGLMTIFFFVVGLEIKREMIHGELRDPRRAALPVFAALGGMVVPAAIYLSLQIGQEGEPGWGIPMATDIAFVVGFMALLGPRVPAGLKIMLLTLAIVDDIGAVLVIAVFYSTNISLVALGLGFAGFFLCFFFNKVGVRRVPVYVIIGAGIWLAFLKSGVHPTVAGVMLGLLTPASAWIGDRTLLAVINESFDGLQKEDMDDDQRHEKLDELAYTSLEAVSPLERLENALHPWVAFVIMPVFALSNAGVPIDTSVLDDSVVWAVAGGLILGKPIGIVIFSWLGVTLGLARLPSGVNWKIMIGAGFLAGIGFTMSLFIAGLAFPIESQPLHLRAAKVGVIIGSGVSAILGCSLLIAYLGKEAPAEGEDDEEHSAPS